MTLPPTLPAYERAAREILPPDVAAYLFGGAGAEATLAANRAAFDRLRLVPRAFGAIGKKPVELFGQRYAAPILVAPMGRQGIFHRDGEAATARAAAALGLGHVIPMLASLPLDAIRTAAEGAPQWLQLYLRRDRDATLLLVRVVEAAGVSAIVVTADAPVDGVRDRQVEAGFRWPEAEVDHARPAFAEQAGLPPFVPGWDDLAWLSEQTSLPLVVKGVMTAEDAILARNHGAAAVIVSNHGGRIIDGVVGALDMLPQVVSAVGGSIPVLFDSGVRRGSDVAKALRLGATAILVGRPVACGLAVAGDRGAAHVLRMLIEEFLIADGLSHRELNAAVA